MAWRRLMQPVTEHWKEFAEDSLGPVLRIPHHPLRMARFGLTALESAQSLARTRFRNPRTRAAFRWIGGPLVPQLRPAVELGHRPGARRGRSRGGLADSARRRTGHSARARRLSHYAGRHGAHLAAHRCGCFPRVGSRQRACVLRHRAATVACNCRRTARASYRRKLERFQHGPGAFKIDYALSEPVPWRAPECRRAITVHLGGTFEEIAAAEDAVARGREAERPFVLAAQPTLFDQTRAPEGRHVLWAYCHVPNGATFDMTERIEAQIERFAPGFRDCVLARRVSPPAALEAMDANLFGGDISGGALTMRQMIFRPDSAQLLDRRDEPLSLFGIDASGRRRAWHVRLSRGADGPAANEAAMTGRLKNLAVRRRFAMPSISRFSRRTASSSRMFRTGSKRLRSFQGHRDWE